MSEKTFVIIGTEQPFDEDDVQGWEHEQKVKEAAQRFVELDERYDEIKKFFDEYSEAKNKLMELAGQGYYFQDSNGVVYKTIVPPGKYVYFETAGVARTSRPLGDGEESKGSYVLTQKEALENGFELPTKEKKPKPKKEQDFSGEF